MSIADTGGDPLAVYVTAPDPDTAETIATALVEASEAACANIVPGVTSVYRWQGQVEIDSEVWLLIKTTRQRLGDLRARVTAMHPDDVPEVIALPIVDGSADYLSWLAEETAP